MGCCFWGFLSVHYRQLYNVESEIGAGIETGAWRFIEPTEERTAAMAFGAENKLQHRKEGQASSDETSRKLIINDKSPALPTRLSWPLYPESEKSQ